MSEHIKSRMISNFNKLVKIQDELNTLSDEPTVTSEDFLRHFKDKRRMVIYLLEQLSADAFEYMK